MNAERKSAVRVFLVGGGLVVTLAALSFVLLLRNRERTFQSDEVTLEEWTGTIPGETFRPAYVARTPFHYWAFGSLRDSRAVWALRHNEGHLRGHHRFSSSFLLDTFDAQRTDFGRKSELWTIEKLSIANELSIRLNERDHEAVSMLETTRDPRTCEDFRLVVGWFAPPIPADRGSPTLEEWSASLPVAIEDVLCLLRTARHDVLVARLEDGRLLVAVGHAHAEPREDAEFRVDAFDGRRAVPEEIRRLRESERVDFTDADEGWLFEPPGEEFERLRIVWRETAVDLRSPPDRSTPIDVYARWR